MLAQLRLRLGELLVEIVQRETELFRVEPFALGAALPAVEIPDRLLQALDLRLGVRLGPFQLILGLLQLRLGLGQLSVLLCKLGLLFGELGILIREVALLRLGSLRALPEIVPLRQKRAQLRLGLIQGAGDCI